MALSQVSIPTASAKLVESSQTAAPEGSRGEPLSLCTAVAVEKEETCLQTGMQSCDQQRVFFFHPLKIQDRRVTDGCQEEEPHGHEPTRNGERQQQQKEQGCGGDGISDHNPVPGLF